MTWWESFKRRLAVSLPSGLSLIRGIFGFMLPFLILSPDRSLHFFSFGLFLFGALTDFLDGWLARKYQTVSDLGKILDPTADKILILAPLVTFSFLGYYSIWWIVPIFVREFLVTFCRVGCLLEGRAVGAERLGKLKFGFQIVTVLGVFFYFLLPAGQAGGQVKNIVNAVLLFCLILSNGSTLISGISFFYANRGHFQGRPFAKYVSACGVGLIPFAPGTWGSLFGVGLFLLAGWNTWLYLAAIVFIGLTALGSISKLNLQPGEDPRFIVIDEVLGMMTALFLIPPDPLLILLGFLFFRLFDVLKPFPLRRLEQLPEPWGILADDLGAGIYTWFILRIILLIP